MALSDAELRRELARYGVNPGPITETTRNVYMKRLEKLKKEKAPKVGASQVGRETRSSSAPKQTSSRRRSKSPTLRSTRSTRNSQITLGYSTDEDERDITADQKKPSNAGSSVLSNTPRSTRQETRKNLATSKDGDSRSSTPIHRRIRALASLPKPSPRRRSSSLQPVERYSDDSDDASERSSTDSWVQMESAETNTTPSLERSNEVDNPRLVKFKAEIEAWKQQEEKDNVSKRNSTPGRLRKIDQGRQANNKTLRNGVANDLSRVVTQVSEDRFDQRSTSRSNDPQTQPWTLSFSSFLPIGTCIFFIVLGLLYATMKYDPSLNASRSLGYDSDEKQNSEIFKLASRIYDYVTTHAGERECGTGSSMGRLEVSALQKVLRISESDKKIFNMTCQEFIGRDDWNLQFFDKSENVIKDSDRYGEAHYVDAVLPALSAWCRFTRAVQKVLLRIIFTTAVGIAIWLGLVYRRYRSEKQREEREEMYIMVQKIIDVLRRQYDSSENNDNVQPFLPILHVRDMILPPKDRKKKANIWERAKQFVSASETRIRVENQTIQGEDYLVWRWIQASSPAKRHTPTSRVWQGEAFDITKGPMICPTPCLKLRNVFNPAMEVDQNWIEQIQDSILEKCQGNNEILRICVEKDSKEGLVYMLCASNPAAGRAFQVLHGAWFDGRLVTVKFIRLHRFHQRFPDSVNQSKVPMCPSSAVPVSTILATPSPPETQQYEKLYPTLPDD